MKVVINKCFGGFGLSRKATARLAELNGRECYFFKHDICTREYIKDDGASGLFWNAFDIPNPNDVLRQRKDWHSMSDDERKAYNELYSKHSLESRPENRACPMLVQVVEELGESANGSCADLKIVEIPDGIEWEIDEYDGNETIHEKHMSWT